MITKEAAVKVLVAVALAVVRHYRRRLTMTPAVVAPCVLASLARVQSFVHYRYHKYNDDCECYDEDGSY